MKILEVKITSFYIELHVEIQLGKCHAFELEGQIKGQFGNFVSSYSCNHLQLADYEEEKIDVENGIILANLRITYDYDKVIIEE